MAAVPNIEKKKKSKTLPQNTDRVPELLLAAATKVFSKKGFEGTTIREIAAECGVNIALVSYYYGGKEALYEACLNEFGKGRLAVAERILQPPSSAEEVRVRLRMFAEEMIESQLSEPELCRMVHQQVEMNAARVKSLFENTFLKVHDRLNSFFKSAQKAGFVRNDLEVPLVAKLLVAPLVHLIRSDGASECFFHQSIKDPKYRAKVLDHLVGIFVEGVLQKEKKS